MTVAYWCVLAVIMMPYIWTVMAKSSAPKFDNHHPREWLARLQGKGARAHAAQQNSFEAMPGFIAAVIIAHLAEAPQNQVDLLAVNFVALRLIYGYLYVVDRPTLRSIIWAAGLACVIALFVISV